MADNASSFARLDEFLDKMRASASLDKDAAADVCVALRKATSANIRAQRDPYGHAWRLSLNTDSILEDAMSAISITSEGTKIRFEVTGPEAMHHVGSAKGYHGGSGAGYHDQANLAGERLGGYRRPLIPFSKIPGPFKTVIRDVLAKRFGEIFE
jgi:hypothetical protein